MATVIELEDTNDLVYLTTIQVLQHVTPQDESRFLRDQGEEELTSVTTQIRCRFVRKVYGHVAQWLAMTSIVVIGFVVTIRFSGTDAMMPTLIRAMLSTKLVDIAVTAGLALVVFLMVTLVGFWVKLDFTILLDCSWLIFVLLLSMPIGSFCMMLVAHSYASVVTWCTVVVLNISLHMVINTQLIFGGRRYEFEFDTYQIGALIEYAEIMAIFMYILPMLCTARQNDILL